MVLRRDARVVGKERAIDKFSANNSKNERAEADDEKECDEKVLMGRLRGITLLAKHLERSYIELSIHFPPELAYAHMGRLP